MFPRNTSLNRTNRHDFARDHMQEHHAQPHGRQLIDATETDPPLQGGGEVLSSQRLELVAPFLGWHNALSRVSGCSST